MISKLLCISAICLGSAFADVYLLNPVGSNGRLRQNGKDADTNEQRRLFDSNNDPQGGHMAPEMAKGMYYFGGSILPIEFWVDNGLGSKDLGGGLAPQVNTVVLQYMCADTVRDGTTSTRATTKDQSMEWDGIYYKYGQHENFWYYSNCASRERNRGLFQGERPKDNTKNTAIYTFQNYNGDAFGFECPEERDYYPYWLPTPWRDIAIMTDDTSKCASMVSQSQNTLEKSYCTNPTATSSTCTQPSKVASWQSLLGSDVIGAPDCIQAPWVMDGVLTNKIDGYLVSYNWTVPMTSGSCALRIRYNVSDVLQPSEGASPDMYASDTLVTLSIDASVCTGEMCKLSLAYWPSTSPFYVYQDRSHTFSILERPITVQNKIHNLNVRGKRGNIVQTYPAVEYDFVPNVLHCRKNEWIHTQWSGSDNNRNNVAGEGTDQTDRSNIVQILNLTVNYPIADSQTNLFPNMNMMRVAFMDLFMMDNACTPYAQVKDNNQAAKNCAKLNPQSPYFDGGLQPCAVEGVYYYMSTRNNNFSNRSQKGTIVVEPCSDTSASFNGCGNVDTLPIDENTLLFDAMGVPGSVSKLLPATTLTLLVVLASYLF